MALTSLVVEPSTRTPLHSVSESNNESPFALLAKWQAFLDVTGKCKEDTRSRYSRTITNFWADIQRPRWTGTREPLEVTQQDLVQYISDIDARGSERAVVIRSMRSFYGFAWDEGAIKPNPAERLRTKGARVGPAPSMTVEETERLFKAAEQLDPRARWSMELQYASVCRAGSLLALEARDLVHGKSGSVIHFRVAKGDKPYAVPASARAMEAWNKLIELRDYVGKRGGERKQTLVGLEYRSYEKWVKEAGLIAGFRAWSHLLRHTAITRLAEAGVDTRTIMELANWADGSLLRRYAAASDPNMRTAADLL